jgi:Lon protease-like protein
MPMKGRNLSRKFNLFEAMPGFYAESSGKPKAGVQSRNGALCACAPEGCLSSLLPLFPLDLVLLPGTPLPLHVFEPRYREMTAECLSQKKPFGVVRAKDEGIAEIGCTAEIVTVIKEYPDGRSDILTRGVRRFELMGVNQERAFLQGEVFYLEDEPGGASAAEIAEAIRLHGEIMALAGGVKQEINSSELQLSFHLVGPLPLDLDFKQTLLGLKSERERIQTVVSYFGTILPTLRRTMHVRQKAGGNGHAG